MVTGIAAANGCTVELVYDRMIGSVINGEEQTIAAHEVTKALLGEDNVRIIRPFMSSEDFSSTSTASQARSSAWASAMRSTRCRSTISRWTSTTRSSPSP